MRPSQHRHVIGTLAGGIAATLFAASLALPVATAQQTQGLATIMGYELLLIGPFGILNGQFGWLATPCLLIAIHAALIRRRPMTRTTAAIAILIMAAALIDALLWNDYPNDGGPGPLASHGPGFFLWVAAVVVGAFGLLTTIYMSREPQ